MAMDPPSGNPYQSPAPDGADSGPTLGYRRLYLAAPPFIPVLTHAVVRLLLPRDDGLAHFFLQLAATLVAMVWSQYLISRLSLNDWQMFALTALLFGAVLMSGFLAPWMVNAIA